MRNTSQVCAHTQTAGYRRLLNKEMGNRVVGPNVFTFHRFLGLQNVPEFHSVSVEL